MKMDCFYLGHGLMTTKNFDEPEALDSALAISNVLMLKQGEAVENPVYDMHTSRRTADTVTFQPKKIIIVEGIFALHYPELRQLADLTIFVDADLQMCFSRRGKRDLRERGRSLESTAQQWPDVETCYREYIEPSKQYAQITLQNNGDEENFTQQVLKVVKRVNRETKDTTSFFAGSHLRSNICTRHDFVEGNANGLG